MSNRRSSWPCPEETLQAARTAKERRGSRLRPHQTRRAGKKNTPRPKPARRKRPYKDPETICKAFVSQARVHVGEVEEFRAKPLQEIWRFFSRLQGWLHSVAASIHS
jgi:hypothetical protein